MLDWEWKRLEKATVVPIESLPEDAVVYVGTGEYMSLDDFLSQKEEYEGQGIHEEAFVCKVVTFAIDIAFSSITSPKCTTNAKTMISRTI